MPSAKSCFHASAAILMPGSAPSLTTWVVAGNIFGAPQPTNAVRETWGGVKQRYR